MLDEIRRSNGYQSIQVITEAAGLDVNAVADILELDSAIVGQVFQSGMIPRNLPDYEEVCSRFDGMLSVMAYFADISDYDKKELEYILSPTFTQEYKKSRVPPPWYPIGAKDYLCQHKLKGLEDYLHWIGDWSGQSYL